jgi:fibronectin type 3 domain-containing protein
MLKRAILLMLALALTACGGGGKFVSPPSGDANGFTLTQPEFIGSGKLTLVAEQDSAGGTVVSIQVEHACDLKAVCLTLGYREEELHPVSANFTNLLGGADETISLSITDTPGTVPAGIVKIHPDTAEGFTGSGELMRVRFAPGKSVTSKSVSKPPSGDANKPLYLTLVPIEGENYRLIWREVNLGDYSNDGTVAISDITPLAQRFNASTIDGDQDEWDDLIDGNRDKKVTIADVTPIAQNFGSELTGYNIFVEGMGTPLPNLVSTSNPYSVMRPDEPGHSRVRYTYDLTLAAEVDVTVVAVDAEGNPGVVSDPAQYSSGLPPQPPQGVTAESGASIGAGAILVSWYANDEPDLREYKVYRKKQGDEDFANVVLIPAATSPLEFLDTAAGQLLERGTSYSYYVTAVNTGDFESDPSAQASATPYYPAPPTAPASLTLSNTDIPYSFAIEIAWEASTSDYLEAYEIWRKAPGESVSSFLASVDAAAQRVYYDRDLEAGQTYTYKARALDAFGEYSPFTDEKQTTPSSGGAPIEIFAVETGRTTLQVNSAERAQLTVDISDPTADITWSAAAGSFPGGNTGVSVTYAPPTSGGAQRVTVNVHAVKNAQTDDGSTELIITTLPTYGSGAVVQDVASPSLETPAAPYVSLQDYLGGHVMLLSFGDLT